jgi:hypothetical protein
MFVLVTFLGGLVVILAALLLHSRMETKEAVHRFNEADASLRKLRTEDRKQLQQVNQELIDLKCFIEEAKADRKDLVAEITKDALTLRTKLLQLIPVLFLCLMFGCSSASRSLDLVYVSDIQQPVPVTDLPESMRVENWIGRDEDGSVGGSCVHASTLNCFRSAGRFDLEQEWYNHRDEGYEGPEADFRLLEKLDSRGIKFAATDDGDIEVLEAASATGRMAVIFYYPSHSINFVEFNVIDGQPVAILLDNNFPDAYIVVPKDVFLDSWRNLYDGFAVVPWIEPNPSRTFPRTLPKRYLKNVYPQTA